MKGTSLDDIIAAISTPIGAGGIGIVRISGNGAIELSDKFFKSKNDVKLINKKSHTLTYGYIIDNDKIIDEVLVSVMKAPNTYTKDDIVEINCHGGIIVTNKVLEIVLKNGARLSEPGEFTKRAFLNGRIDLTQAEAVIDVINSKTDLSRQVAVNQLGGSLKNKVSKIRDGLITMVATLEVAIDYPEHELDESTYDDMYNKCQSMKDSIENLLNSSNKGKIIREGIQTVILGKPNVGKSSLLNRFLNEERAIVTDIPGTTRDTVEEYINIEGVPVKIIDTAGIRNTDDTVEKMGVEKSKDFAKKSDLILMLLDGSRNLDEDDIEILDLIKDKKALVLINKLDLQQKIKIEEVKKYISEENIIFISVKDDSGIDELVKRLKDMFFEGEININDEVLVGNVRHRNSLFNASEALKKAMETISLSMPEDFISMDLQEVNKYLGEITGDSVDEEIIDRIFSQFCLGK